MKDKEYEFEVRFGVTPFFDVPKIEHRRFSEFPCNKKPVLGGIIIYKMAIISPNMAHKLIKKAILWPFCK